MISETTPATGTDANPNTTPETAAGTTGRPERTARSLRPAALLAATLLLVFSCKGEPIDLRKLEKPTAFALIDHDGARYDYTPASGKIRLIFFGYTSCPDFCPNTLAKIEKAWSSLALPQAERPEVLFISVDGTRDTPERLKKYIQAFHIPIRGLTGTKAEIDPVTKMFGSYYRIEVKDGETIVDHSTYVYLVDQEGTVRHHFKTGDTPQRIADGIRSLHAETN